MTGPCTVCFYTGRATVVTVCQLLLLTRYCLPSILIELNKCIQNMNKQVPLDTLRWDIKYLCVMLCPLVRLCDRLQIFTELLNSQEVERL